MVASISVIGAIIEWTIENATTPTTSGHPIQDASGLKMRVDVWLGTSLAGFDFGSRGGCFLRRIHTTAPRVAAVPTTPQTRAGSSQPPATAITPAYPTIANVKITAVPIRAPWSSLRLVPLSANLVAGQAATAASP